MKKSGFSEEKIIEVLKHLEAGRRVSELSRAKIALKAVIEKTAGAGSATRRCPLSHHRFRDERTPRLPPAGTGPLQLALSAETGPQPRAVRTAA